MTTMTHKKTGVRVNNYTEDGEHVAELSPPQPFVEQGIVEDKVIVVLRTESAEETKAAVKSFIDWSFNPEFAEQFEQNLEKAIDGDKAAIAAVREARGVVDH